jgi:hypothetical protein
MEAATAAAKPAEVVAKSQRQKSWVWEHMEVLQEGVRCKHCTKTFKHTSTNTTNFAKHLNGVHKIFESQPVQSRLTFTPTVTPNSTLAHKIPDIIVRLVVQRNLPLSFVEAPELKELCEALRPTSSSALPSRYALREKLIPEAARQSRNRICALGQGFPPSPLSL